MNRRRKVPTLCIILGLLTASMVRSLSILTDINLFKGSTIYLDGVEVAAALSEINLSSQTLLNMDED